MLIEWIKIKGFRNFDDCCINLANQTLIIGANDVGKTNLIYALRILFDRSLSDRDLELSDGDYNVYAKTDEIEITVKLTNVVEDCLRSVFKGDLKEGNVYIQYQNTKNGEHTFLSGHAEDVLENKNSRFYLKRLNMEYVNTNRNLSSFMKREKNQILDDAKISLIDDLKADDERVINDLKENLKTINSKVDNLNYVKKSLENVNSELEGLAIHNEGQKLSFKNASSNTTKLLENLELVYAADGEELTLGGDGRSNQIFLATWVAKQKTRRTIEKVTFFAIEEPEAHLHPHQQKKLSSYLLSNFEDQIFITTHSPHIASEFRPDKIVKLYSKNRKTKVAQGGCSERIKIDFNDFGYRLNAITADVFFVNAVLLVEGPSEKLFYTALSKKLDIDLDRLNISIIPVDGIGFKPYIKICLALDIPFVFRTDNDIFSKTKKISKEVTLDLLYYAGVSRVMGIYEELLKDSNPKLLEYWNLNKDQNEWNKENEIPKETLLLLDNVKKEAETQNIFLSKVDLEEDLANSILFSSLSEFYGTTMRDKVIKKMKKAKAENMLSYLNDNFDSLEVLKNDAITQPLTEVKNLAEKVVRESVEDCTT
ncbi:ATP-dependent nuclease [Saccharibacillus sacchari]|uniref:ATP-dependent nuclease n=1 Tax=Saccharibacillus sacchari TaxID=456493 RepID=UPI0004BAE04B|nr:AAA family ATPase [Saccharibacillus sacchari]